MELGTDCSLSVGSFDNWASSSFSQLMHERGPTGNFTTANSWTDGRPCPGLWLDGCPNLAFIISATVYSGVSACSDKESGQLSRSSCVEGMRNLKKLLFTPFYVLILFLGSGTVCTSAPFHFCLFLNRVIT